MSDTINIDTETKWIEELDDDILQLLDELDDYDDVLDEDDL